MSKKNKVLVAGGCGYIGSHTMVDLIENGFDVISVDNYSNSNPKVLKSIQKLTGVKVKNYKIDICNEKKLQKVFLENKDLVGIIHFAAYKNVGESVDKPLWYFKNNLNSLLNMLEAAKKYKVPNFIFSSSCTVYGNAEELPVTEKTPLKRAESPYGLTKQMGEDIIQSFAKVNPKVNSILLRYFNPAGAHESGLMGEAPNIALNLVPVITELAIGKRKSMTVFGNDYKTRDGSCVRDYIHVQDLANAHTKSLQYLIKNNNKTNCEAFNVGIGEGATVLEAIHAFEKISGKKLNYKIGPRRKGDVVAIYSNYKKAKSKLKWKPSRNIEDIMRTAWVWEQRRGMMK
ncbi:MAG TPA: UDP-glucose 4-epimerase GalE [Phaeodactylibacter sp.]|nr:UDP-glucose 4-epimerase GalE [Phaeodactylibacter sp.]